MTQLTREAYEAQMAELEAEVERLKIRLKNLYEITAIPAHTDITVYPRSGRPVLSIALIVKNEELTLPRLVASLSGISFAHEIVVLDTGSTDATYDIAMTLPNTRVVKTSWLDDFSAARNTAFLECLAPLVMWLDADDVVPQTTVDWLNENIHDIAAKVVAGQLATVRGVYQLENHKGEVLMTYYRERIISASAWKAVGDNPPPKRTTQWQGRVHECIGTAAGYELEVPELVVQHCPLEGKDYKTGQERAIRLLKKDLTDERVGKELKQRAAIYLANTYRELGEHEQAETLYKKALSQYGMVSQWARYDIFVNLAHVAADPVYKCNWLGNAIACDPSRAEAYSLMAWLAAEIKDWKSVLPLTAAALEATESKYGFNSTPDRTWLPKFLQVIALTETGEYYEALYALEALEYLDFPHKKAALESKAWLEDKCGFTHPTSAVATARVKPHMGMFRALDVSLEPVQQ